MTMQDIPSRVDVLSETIALSTYGNTKNIIITAIDVKGPFDLEACKKAAQIAYKNFPELMSRIEETRLWGRHYLVWKPRFDLPLPITLTDLPHSERSGSLLNDIMTVLRPRLDREWNLFQENAVEFHVIQLSDEHRILACVCHHVAADAGAASEFGKQFLMHYHEIITGNMPDWANEGHAISSSRKRPVRSHKNSWKDAIVNSHRGVMQIFEKPVLPVGRGKPTDLSEHFAKKILSEEQSDWIVMSASQSGVSLVDALTASTNLVIDEWNAERDVAPGLLTTAMTVNTRGRFSSFETPNNSSVIFFKSLPHERKDPTSFVRLLARTRMRHFREHKDLSAMHNVRRMIQSLRFFPFRLRCRIVNFMLNRHRFSIAITLLGAVWPKIEKGKMTANTSITRSADLTVEEIHGIGYKLHSGTRLLLIAYTFRNRLNLILHGAGTLFSREETEAFLDLIVNKIQGGRRE
ncbi:MAG: hypothetical protein NTW27_08955 [Deltaproteobacteria bacterium]|nr:hypothetical protein [Deltaproteobacteria bacterium]